MRDITDNRNNISELQRYLRELHHDTDGAIRLVNPDGIYGIETTEAVADFQRIHGLAVTGRTDNATWDAIYREFLAATARRTAPIGIIPFPNEKGYEVEQGEESDTVMAIQLMLRLLSNLYDDIDGTSSGGIYGEQTAADIKAFQGRNNLPLTGKVDKATWNELAKAYNRAVGIEN